MNNSTVPTSDIRETAVIDDTDVAEWQLAMRELHDTAAAPITSEDDPRHDKLCAESGGRIRIGEYTPEELGDAYFTLLVSEIPPLKMKMPEWVVSTQQENAGWPAVSITLEGKKFGANNQWARVVQYATISVDEGVISWRTPYIFTGDAELCLSEAVALRDAVTGAVKALWEVVR